MEAKTQREIAAEVIEEAFHDRKRVSIPEVVATGSERGISRRLLTRVARDLGVRTIQNGPNPGIWERA
jgi:hypothetical protein